MFKFIAFSALFLLPIFVQAQIAFEKKVFVASPKALESRYFYVPFEVPTNTKSLTLSYQYDKKQGANVLDLGVFDSGFDISETSLSGFRGWSGGRRNTIFIAETAATNGYVSGKIPAGTWRVILGLYKIAPEGVEVTVKVKINEIDSQAKADLEAEKNKPFTLPLFKPAAAPPQAHGYTWFRGDLHAHTFHSDGSWTTPMLLAWAQASGLNFLGITEHNTFSHHAEIDRLAKNYNDLLVLRGEEVTTYGGHVNVWGLPSGELIDFRVTPQDSARMRKIVESVRKLELLASLNHPTAVCGGCDWSYGDWTQMDSIEIWNGAWDAQDEAALKKWDELLQQGARVTAIGSSDTHAPPLGENPPPNAAPLGAPTNHVGMKSLSQIELLAAVKRGRVWISDTPTAYSLEFSAFGGQRFTMGDVVTNRAKTIALDCKAKGFPAGAKLTLVSDGKILRTETVENKEIVFTGDFGFEKNSYFRLEVRDGHGKMLAFTNPIYVRLTQ